MGIPQAIREKAQRRAYITRQAQEVWVCDVGWIIRQAGDKRAMLPANSRFVERFRWEASWTIKEATHV